MKAIYRICRRCLGTGVIYHFYLDNENGYFFGESGSASWPMEYKDRVVKAVKPCHVCESKGKTLWGYIEDIEEPKNE